MSRGGREFPAHTCPSLLSSSQCIDLYSAALPFFRRDSSGKSLPIVAVSGPWRSCQTVLQSNQPPPPQRNQSLILVNRLGPSPAGIPRHDIYVYITFSSLVSTVFIKGLKTCCESILMCWVGIFSSGWYATHHVRYQSKRSPKLRWGPRLLPSALSVC